MMRIERPVPFLDFCRPPVGMRLEYLIGTSYTLDLTCLLQVALITANRKLPADVPLRPVEALAAISNFTGKSLLFAQANRINELKAERNLTATADIRQLIALFDDCLETIPPPDAKSYFHPKLWVIKFKSIERQDTSYRLAVLSRNLTQDLSWDVGAVLQGASGDARDQNANLRNFLEVLGEQATTRNTKLIQRAIGDLARVTFKAPEGARSWRFEGKWPKRIRPWNITTPPFDRVIVFSPFINAKVVNELRTSEGTLTLITGTKGLEGALNVDGRTFLMSHEQCGVHAKLYVGQRKGRATDVILGSANATYNGLKGANIEAVLHLEMPANYYDRFHDEMIERDGNLKSWLLPIVADEAIAQLAEDAERNNIEDKLDSVRNHLALGHFILRAKPRLGLSLQFIPPKDFRLPAGMRGYVGLMNQDKPLPLSKLMGGRELRVAGSARTASRFVLIKLTYRKVSVSFMTVARSKINFGARSEAVQQDLITSFDDFVEMLNAILDQDTQTNNLSEGEKMDRKMGGRKRSTIAPTPLKALETLILHLADDETLFSRIDNLLDAYKKQNEVKKGDAEALYRLWESVSRAWRKSGRI